MNAVASDGHIVVSVARDGAGNRDQHRSYRIVVDGRAVGSVKRGEVSEVVLPPGQHRIRVAVSWCSSPEVQFDGAGGERVAFSCGPQGHPDVATPWQLTFGRRSYLRLERAAA
ncbi:hypothetical protein GCM10009839_10090 [Catenulispora yoronensis]|uniref:Uncharacterized protein n=1 Tax=Catenulispora yoronensis TaxID=450799 RepID=A0ABN2TPY2_9ACTN